MMGPIFPIDSSRPDLRRFHKEAARYVRLEFNGSNPDWLLTEGKTADRKAVERKDPSSRRLMLSLRSAVSRVASFLF